ncbi:MAG: glucokinase [Desulfovibrionaceae bacterium]
MDRILAVDMGGTSTRFAWFEPGAGAAGAAPVPAGAPLRLATAGAPDFPALLDQARERGFDPARAGLTVFGVPGAVRGRRCDPPNIAWDIDLDAVGLPPDRALMLNDFVAQAWAIRSPLGRAAEVLQAGEPEAFGPGAAVAALGAGTGLGHCALVPGPGGDAAVPSEGGHAALAFDPGPEADFARFALERTGSVFLDREDVVSGAGLALLVEFHTGERLDPVLAEASLDPTGEAAAWFARFYGRAARDWVLSVLALGGIWISGGIAARRPELVRHPAFLAEFRRSPDYADLLARVPVRRMTDPDAGLWGAAVCGTQRLARG